MCCSRQCLPPHLALSAAGTFITWSVLWGPLLHHCSASFQHSEAESSKQALLLQTLQLACVGGLCCRMYLQWAMPASCGPVVLAAGRLDS